MEPIGLTCLIIACKFEETITPRARQALALAGLRESEDFIHELEGRILMALDWDLNFSTASEFVETFCQKEVVRSSEHL